MKDMNWGGQNSYFQPYPYLAPTPHPTPTPILLPTNTPTPLSLSSYIYIYIYIGRNISIFSLVPLVLPSKAEGTDCGSTAKSPVLGASKLGRRDLLNALNLDRPPISPAAPTEYQIERTDPHQFFERRVFYPGSGRVSDRANFMYREGVPAPSNDGVPDFGVQELRI